ncbi:unnamed protein product [Anisakis simplex]|uniref:t-SNARE coiled-coil homology domain-containing protein n=1 Tax=Anisakis simplex TaxID=6269 RepID=A0A0M3JQN6_ANISI|nr:unnamed protein product [Anisakis simplex]
MLEEEIGEIEGELPKLRAIIDEASAQRDQLKTTVAELEDRKKNEKAFQVVFVYFCYLLLLFIIILYFVLLFITYLLL